jgi:hypothetical protein
MHSRNDRSRPLRTQSPLTAGLAGALLAAAAVGQELDRIVAVPWELDFGHIAAAVETRDYETIQVRRAKDVDGVWVGLRETLKHIAARSGQPEKFELKLIGVEGRSLSASELAQRQLRYETLEGALFYDQGFRVRSAALAANNYVLRFLGYTTRLQRPVLRMAAFSVHRDRSSWLLEIDERTGFPLRTAEYDVLGRLTGELEVTSLRFATPDQPVQGDWWTPSMGVTPHAAARPCLDELGAPRTVTPSARQLPAGFAFEAARVVTDLFNGEKKAVLDYTDGIDHLHIVQRGHPQMLTIGQGDTFAVYEEASMVHCLFVHRHLSVLVIGQRSQQARLKALTLDLYESVRS